MICNIFFPIDLIKHILKIESTQGTVGRNLRNIRTLEIQPQSDQSNNNKQK